VLGALVVAVAGVVAEQLEVDVPVAHRHARVVAQRVTRLAHCGDEPYAGAEVVDHVARMQPLTQLAPVRQVGLGDFLARQHVHTRDRTRVPDGRRPEPDFDIDDSSRSVTGHLGSQPLDHPRGCARRSSPLDRAGGVRPTESGQQVADTMAEAAGGL